MPPRLNIWSATRTLCLRSRPQHQFASSAIQQARRYTDGVTTPPPPPGSEDVDGVGKGPTSDENALALSQLEMVAYGLNPFDPKIEGHKYGLPERKLPDSMKLKSRYHPVVDLVTRTIMRDGKLAKAQRDIAMVLNFLRTSPTPKTDPRRPLIVGSPPPSHLPLDPVTYLTVAIDSVAPLIKILKYKGMAGGGRSLEVPTPLAERQRRRTALKWILEAVAKKRSKGSGRAMFPNRIAEEIVAIVEGRSSVWDKRLQVHKLGTSSRANLGKVGQGRK